MKKYITTVIGLFIAILLMAQEQDVIKGIVLDNEKNPIGNVQISIAGIDPVYTQADGKFEIQRVSEADWLTVKPVKGYHSKQILVTNEESITVYLGRLSLLSGNDQVSLPSGSKKRRNIIASYSTIETDKLHLQPNESAEQYLQGKVPGAFVTNRSGMPGSGATVYLRGYSSLVTNNQPLYIIDGVPLENNNVYNEMIEGFNYNPLANIDPMDITEMTVLKDAAATAMYGVKGANGVVYIKTLQPTQNKTTIDVVYRSGITLAPEQLPQLSAQQYRNLANEVLFSSGQNEETYKLKYPGLYYTSDMDEYVRYNHNTNWQNEIFRNASMQNMRFTIKGGDAIAKYGLSVGYLNNKGIVKNTSLDRFNIRLTGTFDIFSWLKMDVSSSLATNTSFLKESGLSRNTSPIIAALHKSPLLNPYKYDSNGNQLETIDDIEELGVSNPSAIINLFEGKAQNYRFMGSAVLKADISNSLKFRSVIGLNSNNLKEYSFSPSLGFGLMYDGEAERVTRAQNSNLSSFYNDNTFSFHKIFSSVHSVYAGVGLRWQKSNYEIDNGVGKQTASDYYTNLNRGTILPEIGALSRKWNWGAIYSNIEYSYADKYFASASISGDYSSRYGKQAPLMKIGDVQFGVFYSAAAAWRVSEEEFFPQIDALDEFKLRASYGVSGNDDIGETTSYANYTEDQYREVTVLIPGGLSNNELMHQNKEQLGFGFDLNMLASRFKLSADYFINKSDNVLVFEKLNSYIGFKYYPNNMASMTTSGVELSAFYRAIAQNDFIIDLGLNFSKYCTIINSISNQRIVVQNEGDYQIINRNGDQVNSFYGYRATGVFSTHEQANDADLYTKTGVKFNRGDVIFENRNSDNIINEDDMQALGSFEPDFFGGLTIDTRYKNWTLNLFFQGVYGNKAYNYTRYLNESMDDISNQSVKTLQRWQYDGQITTIPKAMWGDPMGNNAFSSRWIEDASYLRLKQLTLSYKVDRTILGISGLNVFATASNLFTLSTYTGYDPEFSYSQNLMQQGVDFAGIPISKQFMIGVKFGL